MTLTLGTSFPPVTEEEALAALTDHGRILSATEVAAHVALERGLAGERPPASKANRALEKLAADGTIVKLDRDNGDDARHLQSGGWQDARYGWALPAAAQAARHARQDFEAAAATRCAADTRDEARIAASVPNAVGVRVYGTTLRGDCADRVEVVKVEIQLPVGGFDAFATQLEKGPARP